MNTNDTQTPVKQPEQLPHIDYLHLWVYYGDNLIDTMKIPFREKLYSTPFDKIKNGLLLKIQKKQDQNKKALNKGSPLEKIFTHVSQWENREFNALEQISIEDLTIYENNGLLTMPPPLITLEEFKKSINSQLMNREVIENRLKNDIFFTPLGIKDPNKISVYFVCIVKKAEPEKKPAENSSFIDSIKNLVPQFLLKPPTDKEKNKEKEKEAEKTLSPTSEKVPTPKQ